MNADNQRELMDVGRMPKTNGRIVHQAHNLNGKDTWYTPPQYIASALEVLGRIDLDPASCEFANRHVGAKVYYDEKTNGLIQPWRGNIWLNPPYSSALCSAFVDKLCGELDAGNVGHAIMLTHNNTDTAWFHRAFARARIYCLTRGRIRFYDENGIANSPTHGHIFLYFAAKRPRIARFADAFAKHGSIARPYVRGVK